MLTLRLLFSSFVLGCLSAPVLAADNPPPADALPLSQILQKLEQSGEVAYFAEIEWEDDDGYWEVEYVTPDGKERTLIVNPISGQAREN